MKNHTPGPWKVEYSYDVVGDYQTSVTDLKEKVICYTAAKYANDKSELKEAEANAILISAAPDLLAACEEFVRKCDCGQARSRRSYAQMKAAIEKATQII